MTDPGTTVHAIYAIGPLAIAGIGMAASKLFGGGKKEQQQTPAFTALDEIRRRRLEELKALQGFQESILGQPSQPELTPGLGSAGSGNEWLAILRRLRGM